MWGSYLRSRLAHPLTRGRSLDDPATTELRRAIIRGKSPLARIYFEWYREIFLRLPHGPGLALELGSGAGFAKHVIPQVVASDVLRLHHIDAVVDAMALPFAAASLRGIFMVNVFHHLPDPRTFLAEATRCVAASGVMCMLEPWPTLWSRQAYRLHNEPFEPQAKAWSPSSGGPLTGANGALPWIVFQRDRAVFEAEFPEWRLEGIKPMTPFRYLLSGGVSMRQLAPSWLFGTVAVLERALHPFRNHVAMFALIILRRVDA